MTSTDAQAMLDLWLEAERRVATGQSYSIGGRSLSRVDANTITEKITYWSSVLNDARADESGDALRSFAQAEFS